MNSTYKTLSSIFTRPHAGLTHRSSDLQQWRGIRVKIFNNNLERGLTFMQRVMQSSGIERMIKNEQIYHIKNSEKRILARKNLQRRLKSQDLARKLKSILVKKVRLDAKLLSSRGLTGSSLSIPTGRGVIEHRSMFVPG